MIGVPPLLPRLAIATCGSIFLASIAFGQDYETGWWGPGDDRILAAQTDYPNTAGTLRILLAGGPMPTGNGG